MEKINDKLCPVCAVSMTEITESWVDLEEEVKTFLTWNCPNCYNYYDLNDLDEDKS